MSECGGGDTLTIGVLKGRRRGHNHEQADDFTTKLAGRCPRGCRLKIAIKLRARRASLAIGKSASHRSSISHSTFYIKLPLLRCFLDVMELSPLFECRHPIVANLPVLFSCAVYGLISYRGHLTIPTKMK